MPELNAFLILVGLATSVDGLLAGASLDQSIKQLPSRHRIGILAFSAYSRAADQGNGFFWYVPLGIGGALLTIVAAVWSLALRLPPGRSMPLVVAGVLSIAHSITTARAAPINLSQRGAGEDEKALAAIFDRFEHWQSARAAMQLATFLLMVWALAAVAGD